MSIGSTGPGANGALILFNARGIATRRRAVARSAREGANRMNTRATAEWLRSADEFASRRVHVPLAHEAVLRAAAMPGLPKQSPHGARMHSATSSAYPPSGASRR